MASRTSALLRWGRSSEKTSAGLVFVIEPVVRTRKGSEFVAPSTAGEVAAYLAEVWKTGLMVFTAEEGGAQHCQRDYLSLGAATMFDWLEDKLVRNR